MNIFNILKLRIKKRKKVNTPHTNNRHYLTNEEIVIIYKLYKTGLNYIVRNKNGELWACVESKIVNYTKNSKEWESNDNEILVKDVRVDLFKFIKWEDTEPTSLKSLLLERFEL